MALTGIPVPFSRFRKAREMAHRHVILFIAIQGVVSPFPTPPLMSRSRGRESLGQPNPSRAGSLIQSIQSSNSDTEYGSPSQMLYKEQEKLLIARGKIEADLMKDARTSVLAPSAVKGAGSSGGFGTAGKPNAHGVMSKRKQQKSTSSHSKSRSLEGSVHAAELQREGVIRIDNVLSASFADRLRKYVFQLRQESEKLVREGKCRSIDRFADVLLQDNRCDLKIPLLAGDQDTDAVVGEALHQLLVTSPVGATIKALLGPDALLQELSCLMSDPGSNRQVLHPDTPCSNSQHDSAVLYTCFVALQDIESDMGPTIWLPRTHTWDIHQAFNDDFRPPGSPDGSGNAQESAKDQLLRQRPVVLGMLPKGCCGIFDSRLLHCGGANTSEITRAIFYFSFKNPSIGNSGNPPSIRPELIGQFTLSDLEKELILFNEGKPPRRIISQSGR